MSSWITEGTAYRTPVQRTPVIHLILTDTEEMWCSGGKGRPDAPYGDRWCRKCLELARDAVEAGDLDRNDPAIVNWPIDRRTS